MKSILFGLAMMVASLVAVNAQASCIEGQTQMFIEASSTGEGTQRVIRTCHNGSFYPPVAAPVYRTCVEGKTEIFFEDSGEGMTPVHRTCRNGSFYPRVRAPKAVRCVEGSQQMFLEDRGSSDGMGQVWYTCRDGKYVRNH